MKFAKMDRAADRWIQLFLDSSIFRWCVYWRRSMALLALLFFTTYLYSVYSMLRTQQPDFGESTTFIFLVSLPMGTCLYFTCGFHIVEKLEPHSLNYDLKDVQVANPFDRLWIEALEEGSSGDEAMEHVPFLMEEKGEIGHYDVLVLNQREQHSLNM